MRIRYAVAAAALLWGGAAHAQQVPFGTSVTLTTSAAQLIAANPSRRALTICTPGSTNVVAIAPAPLTPAQPAGPGIIITGTATSSTCFTTALVGSAQGAWNGVASASTIVLVLEY